MEKRIGREDDPRTFAPNVKHNRWTQAVNTTVDRLSTNVKQFGTKATETGTGPPNVQGLDNGELPGD